MRPVMQTDCSLTTGNCFAACIASILELPLDAVPNLIQKEDWQLAFSEFCQRHGYALMPVPNEHFRSDLCHGVYSICSGHREGTWHPHAVVACGDEIVHDPLGDAATSMVAFDLVFLSEAERGE